MFRTLRKASIAAALAAVCSLLLVPAGASAANPFVPGEVIVQYDDGTQRLLELPEDVGVRQAAKELAEEPEVAYAVPNYIARAAAFPNDRGPRNRKGNWRAMQWNFLACGSLCDPASAPLAFQAAGGINALGAWQRLRQRKREGGRGVVIAVLDGGIAYRTARRKFRKSPDFARNQFVKPRDFVRDNRLPFDRDGHGTHVAGTIAERTNNWIGLTGLAYNAKLMPVRILNSGRAGTAHDITRGIYYAAKSGANVINMSLEFRDVSSCDQIPTVCRALNFAVTKRRSTVVAATGNSGAGAASYPARHPSVIGVGGTTSEACLASYANHGPGLDLVAPGGGTPRSPACQSVGSSLFSRSAPIFQMTFLGPGFKRFGFPGGYVGTSMAAAHVSGVAAMVIGSRVLGPRPAPKLIECQLEATARRNEANGLLGEPYDPNLHGAGLIDAARAVTARAPSC